MKNFIVKVDIGPGFFNSNDHPLLKLTGVGNTVSIILKSAFVLAGVSLLIFFIIAGIGMISGAGQSSPEKLEKSKQAVTSALIGFVVVFVAYWVVKLIELITGLTLI